MAQLQFNLMPERRVWSVSELTARVRDLLARNFTDIWVQGEISNCREAQSGHIYCTLKDERAQVREVFVPFARGPVGVERIRVAEDPAG